MHDALNRQQDAAHQAIKFKSTMHRYPASIRPHASEGRSKQGNSHAALPSEPCLASNCSEGCALG